MTSMLGAVAVAVVGAVVVLALYLRRIGKPAPSDKAESPPKSKVESSRASFPAGELLIYFGSQTGTAENFAKTLQSEGRKKGFDAKVVDLEEFDPVAFAKPAVCVFLMATYGEGEPTDNAAKFHRYLRDEDGLLSQDALADLQFAVFGLGNRQYEHFNRMGKSTDALLAGLGARRVSVYGEGDDNECIEDDFAAWRTGLWPALVDRFHPDAKAHLRIDVTEEECEGVELSFAVRYLDSGKSVALPATGFSQANIASSTRYFFTAPEVRVTVNRELRQGGEGSTRHMEFSLEGSGLSYQTADNLAVLPENPPEVVLAFARTMGLDVGQLFAIEALPNQPLRHPFPTPCTIGEALTKYFELQTAPRIAVLQRLLCFVRNPSQRQWLEDVLSPTDRHAAFRLQIEGSCRSLADVVLHSLSSLTLTLAELLHVLPHMQPRYYTTCSSSSLHPTHAHIAVSVTEFKSREGRVFSGLCSSYLRQLNNPAYPNAPKTCRAFVRASSFRLPASLATPVIMVGPGTGVAPMRALLQERQYQAERSKFGKAENILYFGCRTRATDYIYQTELEAFEASGTLSALHLAFSREGAGKLYVQHLLSRAEDGQALVRRIEEGAFVFVCGGTAMGADVHKAVVTLLEQSGRSAAEALATVEALQKEGRYVQELWSA